MSELEPRDHLAYLYDDAGLEDNIFIPIEKRGPPFNSKTNRYGYNRGLYDKFLKINFANCEDLDECGENQSKIDVKSLGFGICT